jgi:hypothetical protein
VLCELGGLQVLAVDSNNKLLALSATASTGPISHLVSHPLFFVDLAQLKFTLRVKSILATM